MDLATCCYSASVLSTAPRKEDNEAVEGEDEEEQMEKMEVKKANKGEEENMKGEEEEKVRQRRIRHWPRGRKAGVERGK